MIGLFREGELSAGRAAELLEMSGREEFLDLLARYQIPYAVLTAEDLEHDLNVLEQLRGAHGQSSPTPGR